MLTPEQAENRKATTKNRKNCRFFKREESRGFSRGAVSPAWGASKSSVPAKPKMVTRQAPKSRANSTRGGKRSTTTPAHWAPTA